ncbi:MAG: hypothetical protein Q4F95_09725 [Oscillospiraceae bacterium]|nr:hypothetical protein [Oscillospiraceae bacterium]
MYEHCDLNDSCISLHDCHAEKMNYENGILSFVFPDGFWITDKHPCNKSDNCVRTSSSQVDFQILDEETDSIEIYVFRKNRSSKLIREDREPDNFISAVNSGDLRLEFIKQYKSFQSFLFKCWVWFEKPPYHYECEVILHSEKAVYKWNQLRYDRVW